MQINQISPYANINSSKKNISFGAIILPTKELFTELKNGQSVLSGSSCDTIKKFIQQLLCDPSDNDIYTLGIHHNGMFLNGIKPLSPGMTSISADIAAKNAQGFFPEIKTEMLSAGLLYIRKIQAESQHIPKALPSRVIKDYIDKSRNLADWWLEILRHVEIP